MFKLFALFFVALIAHALGAPKPLVAYAEPLVAAAPVAYSSAYSVPYAYAAPYAYSNYVAAPGVYPYADYSAPIVSYY